MALGLITEQTFRTSRYGQLADQIEGNLSDIIAQAEAHIQSKVDRVLVKATHTENFFPRTSTIFLRQRPVRSITSIRRRATIGADWETLDAARFSVNTDSGFIRDSDDQGIVGYEVEVVYVAGYDIEVAGQVPSDLQAAVIVMTAYLAYQDLEVYGVGDSKPPGIEYFTQTVNSLIKPYKSMKMP